MQACFQHFDVISDDISRHACIKRVGNTFTPTKWITTTRTSVQSALFTHGNRTGTVVDCLTTSILVGRHVSREFVKESCLLPRTCCIKTSLFSVYSTSPYFIDSLYRGGIFLGHMTTWSNLIRSVHFHFFIIATHL